MSVAIETSRYALCPAYNCVYLAHRIETEGSGQDTINARDTSLIILGGVIPFSH